MKKTVNRKSGKKIKNKEPCFEDFSLRDFMDDYRYEKLVDILNDEVYHETFQCLHKECIEYGGHYVCSDCGSEQHNISYEPEWHAVSNNAGGNKSRCNDRKSHGYRQTRSVDDVFIKNKIESLFSDSIKDEVDKKYKIIVGETKRKSKGRDSIIAVCLWHSLKEIGDIRTLEDVTSMFSDVDNRNSARALTMYYANFKEKATEYIKPKDLVRRMMQLTGVNHKHFKNITLLCDFLDGRSQTMIRSQPQSVVSSIIFLYLSTYKHISKEELKEYKNNFICGKRKDANQTKLSKSVFAKKAGLSDITVDKIVKDLMTLVNCVVSGELSEP